MYVCWYPDRGEGDRVTVLFALSGHAREVPTDRRHAARCLPVLFLGYLSIYKPFRKRSCMQRRRGKRVAHGGSMKIHWGEGVARVGGSRTCPTNTRTEPGLGGGLLSAWHSRTARLAVAGPRACNQVHHALMRLAWSTHSHSHSSADREWKRRSEQASKRAHDDDVLLGEGLEGVVARDRGALLLLLPLLMTTQAYVPGAGPSLTAPTGDRPTDRGCEASDSAHGGRSRPAKKSRVEGANHESTTFVGSNTERGS